MARRFAIFQSAHRIGDFRFIWKFVVDCALCNVGLDPVAGGLGGAVENFVFIC
jgi:hypothetical protein